MLDGCKVTQMSISMTPSSRTECRASRQDKQYKSKLATILLPVSQNTRWHCMQWPWLIIVQQCLAEGDFIQWTNSFIRKSSHTWKLQPCISHGCTLTVEAVTHADKARNNQTKHVCFGRERHFEPYISIMTRLLPACLDPTVKEPLARVPQTSWNTCMHR
jgi:hypothetical protein